MLNPSQSKLSSSANVFSPTMLIASMEDPNRQTYTMTPLGSPTRASTPHISYPDIDLALPIYDSYHNIPDDDPHWTTTELDLNAIYIYDSDEDLSMYDNPPSSPWLTTQLSPPPPPALYQPPSTLTLPNLRPTQHPTLESLLEWQTRLGLRCCTSFVSPGMRHPDSLFSSNPTTGSSHYDPPLAEGIYCVASEAGGYECTSTTAAMGHVLKPLSSQTPQTPQDSIVTTPTALITKSINQTVLHSCSPLLPL